MSQQAGELARLSLMFDRYDGLLSDIWGVLHNGVRAHPGAVGALTDFRAQGGHVVLITNAARTGPVIVQMLDELGVPRDAYDGIVTSGDVTRALIAAYRGKNIHHVGPATDHPMLEGLGIIKTSSEDAEVVVVTGLDDPSQMPETYSEKMEIWLERKLPMICANPDKVVEIGDRLFYCAGALADLYEERGGTVELAGKPAAPIYDAAFAALDEAAGKPVARERVLAIGDSVRTDATGAGAIGIDFLFITGSIHAGELDAFSGPGPESIAEFIAPSGAKMIGFQPRLE